MYRSQNTLKTEGVSNTQANAAQSCYTQKKTTFDNFLKGVAQRLNREVLKKTKLYNFDFEGGRPLQQDSIC